jgi:hypothetical protein
MAVYTYRQVRGVLRKLGFRRVRIRKHETWEKILDDGSVLQVRLSHKGGRDVRRGLLRRFCARWGLIARRLRSWCEVVRACRSVPSVALFCGLRDSLVVNDGDTPPVGA